MNAPPEDGYATVDLSSFVEAHISTEGCGVTANLTLILDHDTAAKGSDIASDMPPDTNAAGKTRHFDDLFTRTDTDVVPELGTIVGAVGKSCGRKGRCKK